MKKILSMVCAIFCLSTAYATEGVDARIAKALEGIERNSSPAVDAIYLLGSKDAKEITTELEKEAILFICNNYPDYYKDAGTMEKTMYYGHLLKKAFKDDRAQLGWYAVKAVKYVYRGHENPDDEATKINLRKIEKTLKKIRAVQ